MTDTAATFPYLELGPAVSDFDEAVILINGHEEETIRIECADARKFAERLVWLVNNFQKIITVTPGERGVRSALGDALRAQAGDIP